MCINIANYTPICQTRPGLLHLENKLNTIDMNLNFTINANIKGENVNSLHMIHVFSQRNVES